MKTIKAIRIALTVAAVLLVATISVPAGEFAVKLKLTGYARDQAGTALVHVPLGVLSCSNAPGAQLAALVDDATSNITALVTVDACGNVLCTDLVVTASCSQLGVSSNGKALTGLSATHVQYNMNSAQIVLNGDGFLLEQGTANPTNSTDVTAYTAKGTINLCNSTGAIIAGTITVGKPIKIGKNCP